MCYGQKVEQTREDRECWGAAVDRDVGAGRSGRKRKRRRTLGSAWGGCSEQKNTSAEPGGRSVWLCSGKQS